jgi:phosphate uptake regulator
MMGEAKRRRRLAPDMAAFLREARDGFSDPDVQDVLRMMEREAATDPEAAKHWAVMRSVRSLFEGLTDGVLNDAMEGKLDE